MAKTPDFKYERNIGEMLAKQRKPDPLPDTGWAKVGISENWEITFEGSWSNVGGSMAPAGHYLSEDGETRSRGVIKGGSEGDIIYTLPEEHLPEYFTPHVVAVQENGNWGVGIVTVETNGDVKFARKIVGFTDISGTMPVASLPAHHTTHELGGSDAIKLDDLSTPDDNTDLNASTSRHGLLLKLSGVSGTYLNGMGQWASVVDGGSP